jgi:hypothetical protein
VELAQAFVSKFISVLCSKLEQKLGEVFNSGEIMEINLRQKGDTQLKQSKENENLCLKLSGNVKHNWNVNQTKKNILSEIF